jgi:hypothetical protein
MKSQIKSLVKNMYSANRVLVKTNTQEASEEFKKYFFAVVEMTGCDAEKLLELIRVETIFKSTSQRLSEQRQLDDIFANPEKYL